MQAPVQIADMCVASMHASSYDCTTKSYCHSSDYSLGEITESSLNTTNNSIQGSNNDLGYVGYRQADIAQGVMRQP